jgi:hypothetical protein
MQRDVYVRQSVELGSHAGTAGPSQPLYWRPRHLVGGASSRPSSERHRTFINLLVMVDRCNTWTSFPMMNTYWQYPVARCDPESSDGNSVYSRRRCEPRSFQYRIRCLLDRGLLHASRVQAFAETLEVVNGAGSEASSSHRGHLRLQDDQ